MKVTGPHSGLPVEPAEVEPTKVEATRAGEAGPRFSETLAAASAAPQPGAAGAPTPVTDVGSFTADIAADLRAGRLGRDAALERVVERVLDRQLGVDAPASVRETVRAALRDALGSDPALTSQLRALAE
jgi:hypothetical protein